MKIHFERVGESYTPPPRTGSKVIRKELDTKRLVAQTLFGEANNDEAEMRTIASIIKNRTDTEKSDINKILAAKDSLGRFEFQGISNAQARKYLSGDLGGAGEREKAALAERIADELVTGKLTPTTTHRFFSHIGGKIQTEDRQGSTPPGTEDALAEFMVDREYPVFVTGENRNPQAQQESKKPGLIDRLKGFLKGTVGIGQGLGSSMATERQSSWLKDRFEKLSEERKASMLKQREYFRLAKEAEKRDLTPEERMRAKEGQELFFKEGTDLALGFAAAESGAVKAVGKDAMKRIAAAKDADTVKDIVSKLGVTFDDAETWINRLVKADKPGLVKSVFDVAQVEGAVKSTLQQAAPAATRAARPLINVERYAVDEKTKKVITDAAESVRPELEAFKGAPLKHEEVLEAAGNAEVLKRATTREATLKREAELLRLRQQVAALAEKDGAGISKEFVDSIQTVSNELTSIARQLNAAAIDATSELVTNKTAMVKKLLELGNNADDIVKAAQGVDFNDARQATDFYRKFVKPSIKELLDEYRYINLLSSPKTHIVNAFSNLLQATVLRPGTKLASGAVDFVGSALTGKQRQMYASEIAPYTKGAVNSVPEAVRGFLDALSGKTATIRPDLQRIPTGSKLLRPFQVIPRLLEGGDIFFRTLIKAGEKESLLARAVKQGKTLDDRLLRQIEQQASDVAEEYVFRKALDPSNASGQGKLLSGIDKVTAAVYRLRAAPAIKWFVPFIQTPMNILKQGIEYSPLGVATLPGAANKIEQLGKTLVGTTVFAGAATMGAQGRLTWAAPKSEKEKKAFYASGRKPYSVKIGDNWVSYTKLGPLAYPFAMAAAIQWYTNENPKASTDTAERKLVNVISGIGRFFADQSYVQGMNNMLQAVSGDVYGLKNVLTNVPQQLIPLVSLQRWASQIIDPVYRESAGDISMKAVIQNIQKGIPFLSRGVPAETDPAGRPSRVQHPLIRALSPFDVGTTVPKYENLLQRIRREQRLKAIKDKREASGTSSGFRRVF